MSKRIVKISVLTLMILNGVFFLCNISVLGNHEAIISMHRDLMPSASDLLANSKVLGVFITGILYIITAINIIRQNYKTAFVCIIIGFIINSGLYIVQLVLWANLHPRIWIHFAIFSGINLFYVVYTWLIWKRRIIHD